MYIVNPAVADGGSGNPMAIAHSYCVNTAVAGAL